jgi:hypothetical protein
MSLREDIADAIEAVFYEGGPAIYDQAAAAVLALLRSKGERVEYDSADDAYARDNRWETKAPDWPEPWVINLLEGQDER